ncbi:MAG: leucyl/phenylalanyl-tRNA--protein transferase [Leptospiraceae bacterium]|nr:leucyl/phenylalanyl-tRNA--protein transferase [Leptospiraceae bacterium]
MSGISPEQEQESFKRFFRNPLDCKDDLVAIGGDFSPERLFYAYANGIFPWTESPIRWYSPDPRAIFNLDEIHISRTIKRKIRKKVFRITTNVAFREVMIGCSHRINETSWITEGFITGYTELHKRGYAHSFEAWDEKDRLVGGVYGVAIGKFFAGESMFAIASDAGKIALMYLFAALERDGFTLFDTQALNEVTWNLGAYEVHKSEYLFKLKEAVKIPYKWTPSSIYETEKFLLYKMNSNIDK